MESKNRPAKSKFYKMCDMLLILAVVLVLIPIGMTLCTYEVQENQYAVVTKLGKIARIKSDTGLFMKIPFIESVRKVPKEIQVYDIRPSDATTKDKKSMIADNFILWRVTDPAKYVQTLNSAKTEAENRVSVAAYNSTKNTISSMTQDELMEARGESLTDTLTKEANSDISGYGIEILQVTLKSLDLPDDNKSAVYQRMISERENIAASYRAQGNSTAQKIRNDTDKQVAIIKADAEKEAAKIEAEGESEYMKTLQEAYNTADKADFYNFLRGLDALETSLKSSEDNTIILNKDSEIVRILNGSSVR